MKDIREEPECTYPYIINVWPGALLGMSALRIGVRTEIGKILRAGPE